MKRDYKIGDRVIINKDQGLTQEGPVFVDEMLKMRGKTCTVKRITQHGYLHIESYLFLPKWVTPAEPVKITDTDPTGPVSSLLWEAAKYGALSINPRSMLNSVRPKGLTMFGPYWEGSMALGFLAMAMNTKGERYCLEAGEDVMALLFAAMLAQDAGY